jgi:UDP-N-acetylmuramoyl-L-alanyl-D-glutamate--2,6-diaminopimelate ligase
VNGDDTYGSRIYNEVRGQRRMAWKFSRQGNGELSVAGAEFTLSGIRGTLKTPAGDIPLRSKLIGSINLENILAGAGLALGVGLSRRDVQDGIERTQSIPGRMERISGHGKDADSVVALVDYAHTDDALRRSLETLRTLSKGRIITVFGCGGERDKGKRPLMGQAAAENSDVIVLTSDNPRSEDPEDIISQITPGVENAGMRRMSAGKAKSGEKGYLVEVDRAEAIQAAVNLAKAGDVVLVAGKGHEKYQIQGAERRPFDDREEVSKALSNRS